MSLKAFKILYGIYNDYSEFKKSKENPILRFFSLPS